MLFIMYFKISTDIYSALLPISKVSHSGFSLVDNLVEQSEDSRSSFLCAYLTKIFTKSLFSHVFNLKFKQIFAWKLDSFLNKQVYTARIMFRSYLCQPLNFIQLKKLFF